MGMLILSQLQSYRVSHNLPLTRPHNGRLFIHSVQLEKISPFDHFSGRFSLPITMMRCSYCLTVVVLALLSLSLLMKIKVYHKSKDGGKHFCLIKWKFSSSDLRIHYNFTSTWTSSSSPKQFCLPFSSVRQTSIQLKSCI